MSTRTRTRANYSVGVHVEGFSHARLHHQTGCRNAWPLFLCQPQIHWRHECEPAPLPTIPPSSLHLPHVWSLYGDNYATSWDTISWMAYTALALPHHDLCVALSPPHRLLQPPICPNPGPRKVTRHHSSQLLLQGGPWCTRLRKRKGRVLAGSAV